MRRRAEYVGTAGASASWPALTTSSGPLKSPQKRQQLTSAAPDESGVSLLSAGVGVTDLAVSVEIVS